MLIQPANGFEDQLCIKQCAVDTGADIILALKGALIGVDASTTQG